MQKYRVWSNEQKKMYYHGVISFDLHTGNWDLEAWVTEYLSEKFVHVANNSSGVAMLSSGYSDKNRREIFESDILQKGECRCVVKFAEGRLYFDPVPGYGWIDDWNWADDSRKFEVIGNEHEDQNLLY